MSVDLEKVKQAEALSERYHEAYCAKRDLFMDLLREYVTETFKCHAGTMVVHRGETLKVEEISKMWDYDKPWIKARRKKKDGEWGEPRNIYGDWEPVST